MILINLLGLKRLVDIRVKVTKIYCLGKLEHIFFLVTKYRPMLGLVSLRCCISPGAVLLITFWPAVEDDDKKVRAATVS